MSNFSRYHPLVNFIYFASVIFLTMFSVNPIFLGTSLIASITYSFLISKKKIGWRNIGWYFIIMIIITFTNPLFGANGDTLLFTIGKIKFTKEALFYGFVIALMFFAIWNWFKTYNIIMTSDKFIYLFGKYLPATALIISMGLKLIPEYQHQITKINEVQTTLGLYHQKGIIKKIKTRFKVLISLINWALENSMETANAMKARGYNVQRRTSFSLYKFTKNDLLLLVFNIVSVIYLLTLGKTLMSFLFYPTLEKISFSYSVLPDYIIMFILMFLPVILELKERIIWRYSSLKISVSNMN